MSRVTLIAYHKSVSDRLTHEIRRYNKPDWNNSTSECKSSRDRNYNRVVLYCKDDSRSRLKATRPQWERVAVIAYKCIIHAQTQKIVEKKLRTQIFTSGFANFSVFRGAPSAFLQNRQGKRPSKSGQRIERGSIAPFRPPAHRRG